MLGINSSEFVVLLIVFLVVLGPARTVHALSSIRRGIGAMREWSAALRHQFRQAHAEDQALGEAIAADFQGMAPSLDAAARSLANVNDLMKNLDPSSLDPRAMIREAVAEEMKAWIDAASQSSRRASADSTSTKNSPSGSHKSAHSSPQSTSHSS